VRSLSGTASGVCFRQHWSPTWRTTPTSPPNSATGFSTHAAKAPPSHLRSAIARGDIRSDIDLDFVLDALAAPLYYRILFGHLPVSDRLAEQAVSTPSGCGRHAVANHSRVDKRTP
jgi:hypothetical protein